MTLETDPTAPEPTLDPQACQELIDAAVAEIEQGSHEAAFAHCRIALQNGRLTLKQSLWISNLMIAMRQTELATDLRSKVEAHLETLEREHHDNPDALREAGAAYRVLGQEEKGQGMLGRAFQLEPTHLDTGMHLSAIHLHNGDVAAALAHWEPVLPKLAEPWQPLLWVAQICLHLEMREEAEKLLDRTEPYCKGAVARERYAAMRAVLRGEAHEPKDLEAVAKLFDKFSDSYDVRLRQLENHGPEMVGDVLARLDLPRDGSLRVLDAGCGTGLCVPYVAPFASVLHGVDISIGMLKTARAKGVYHFLTRCDLTRRETFPAGEFDLVISNDALVYLGGLDAALSNLFESLAPGGWLVFTVEDAGETFPAEGYRVTPSGRFAHGEPYLRAALDRAGFLPPEVVLRTALRNEFSRPVAGLALAARRPA